MQKIIKVISIVLFQTILIFIGILAGMQNEKNIIKQEEQAEIVTDIAVVNLDEGVFEENKKSFYFSEVMNLEEDFFVSENLEAARAGINNGSYAAYILIPAEFSQNAVSINNTPTKAILEFAINPNLREDISRLTMANIKNFEIALNTNMSYMYVQAILEEFHDVQDQAGFIMENDSEELQRILGIDAEKLLTEPEFGEIEWAKADLEEVDFSDFYEKNVEIANELRDNYDLFVKQGEKAFSELKDKEETVIDGVDELYKSLEEIDIETDDEGNIVYEEGLQSLSDYLKEYDEAYEKQKEVIWKMLGLKGEVEPQPSVSPTVTPAKTPENDATPTPTATSTPTPTETPTPISTATPSATPEDESTPTPTVTPTPTQEPIPELLRVVVEGSLTTANEKITESNKENAEIIKEIQEYILQIEELMENTSNAQLLSVDNSGDENDEVQPEELEAPTVMSAEEKVQEEESAIPEMLPLEEEAQEEESEIPVATAAVSPEMLTVDYSIVNEAGSGSGSADSAETVKEYLELIKVKLEGIEDVPPLTVEDMYNLEAVMKEFKKLAAEIEKLPKVDQEQYNSIFETEVLQPLQDEILAENEKVQKEGDKFMEIMEKYMEELSDFDIYEYYDYEKADELMNSFADNVYALEEESYETHTEYMDLVYNTVDTANESVETLREDLSTAYEGTTENVQKEVSLAKEYRENINQTNVEILGNFREKLPYTRIGNLEYVQAYDFVANPVKLSDASVDSHDEMILQDFDTIRNLLMMLIILWCISLFSLLAMKLYESKKEGKEKA